MDESARNRLLGDGEVAEVPNGIEAEGLGELAERYAREHPPPGRPEDYVLVHHPTGGLFWARRTSPIASDSRFTVDLDASKGR